jgi:glucose/arabinose dehydrogenase
MQAQSERGGVTVTTKDKLRHLFILTVLGFTNLQAQTIFSAQSVRYQTEVLATGLHQPSAMVFLPDGRALVVERRSAKIDLLDVKSGSLTALDHGFEAVIGSGMVAQDVTRPPISTGVGEDAGLHDIALHGGPPG